MAQCLAPFTKKDPKEGQFNTFPCGKCNECKKRRISGWSFRLMKQYEVSETAHFLTLTYDTQHIPITPNNYMSLDKSDIQKFFKRLRKRHSKNLNYKHLKISYYICGEYGSKRNRPHYHAIIFNADTTDLEAAWTIYLRDKRKYQKIGDIHVAPVNEATVGYTLKYMSKDSRIPLHQNDDRTPEFANMSKGLGSNYL